ncbi:MAG: nucleotide pyrophosphohydrolase [Candidatus Hodarchaeales archaeon]|jgi:NTP pyrophosphatase (non-canonical NTP hydrolase)
MVNEINNLQNLIADFVKARDWNKFHQPKNLAMSISIEAAELMEVFQWFTHEEVNNLMEELKPAIEDEIADIMIYLLSFAKITNIDINNAVRRKMARNEDRFQIKNVKGKLP